MFQTFLLFCNHSTDAFILKGAVLPQVKLLGSNDSVMEIDTNGNFEIELKFKQPLVYEADRLSQKNYYLDFESSLKINRSVLCSSEMKKDQKNVITIRGNVVNLPDIDCAWKIKVELFKSEPRANSSQQLSLITSPKPKKFQHILTYPTLAPKSNEPDDSYRYNFDKINNSESAMAKEKESMVKLYNAYLNIAKAKSTYNMVNSVVENVVAYKLSLQMVRMRMIKDIKE
uniref:CS domain-containing protein n=1 Tax=Globodera pallida TaxID=36090 RepID=A0A183BZQ9_GLOPA